MNDARRTPASEAPQPFVCDDLDHTIEQYIGNGYRLDMIGPADSPREALMSRGGERIRLLAQGGDASVNGRGDRAGEDVSGVERPMATLPDGHVSDGNDWLEGRAGMMYRDLLPERLGGKLIASHIRITDGGPVADYVHYHNVRFQMIYCLAGAIEVVYEDQGPPFALLPGDCVLQPPEIRHRVLHAEAGSEVLELGMPAVHETWVEHEITLPTAQTNPERDFSGQRFVRHTAGTCKSPRVSKGGTVNLDVPPVLTRGLVGWSDTGIAAATGGFADVKVIGLREPSEICLGVAENEEFAFCFVLSGGVVCQVADETRLEFAEHDAFVVEREHHVSIICPEAAEILLAVVEHRPEV